MRFKPGYLALILSMTTCTAFAQAAPGTASTAMSTPPPKPAPPAATAVPAPVGPPAATASTAPVATNNGEKIILCPTIDKLIKKELFWGAPDGWRSYSQSFVNSIETFVGAQWVGVEVGKMLCVYKGKESFDFPVVLQKDTLTPSPKGERWIAQKGGYVNCLSNMVERCPFHVKVETQDMNQIYNDLDFKKKTPGAP